MQHPSRNACVTCCGCYVLRMLTRRAKARARPSPSSTRSRRRRRRIPRRLPPPSLPPARAHHDPRMRAEEPQGQSLRGHLQPRLLALVLPAALTLPQYFVPATASGCAPASAWFRESASGSDVSLQQEVCAPCYLLPLALLSADTRRRASSRSSSRWSPHSAHSQASAPASASASESDAHALASP